MIGSTDNSIYLHTEAKKMGDYLIPRHLLLIHVFWIESTVVVINQDSIIVCTVVVFLKLEIIKLNLPMSHDSKVLKMITSSTW